MSIRGERGPDGGDAQRPARLLRRRLAAPREVAVARARARRPELGGRLLHRRAPARTSRRGLLLRRRRRHRVGRGTSTAGQTVTPESTVAALAANLTATTDGEPAPAAAATPASGSTTTEAESSATAEAESSAGTAESTTTAKRKLPRRPWRRAAESHKETLNLNSRLKVLRRQSSGGGREFGDLQRILRDWQLSLTGRSSLHNVPIWAVRMR